MVTPAPGSSQTENGPWNDDTVSYTYTNRLRSSLKLLQPNAAPWELGYGYDGGKRLKTLSFPGGTFIYTYRGAGTLFTNLALPNTSVITNAYDSVARLTGSWLRKNNGTVLNSHAYVNNAANRRTKQTRTGGSYVDYTYDNSGQLKTAVGKEAGGSLRLQEQLGYLYDPAGNLSQRTNRPYYISDFGSAFSEARISGKESMPRSQCQRRDFFL